MRMLEHEMAEMEKQEKAKKQAADEHTKFTKDFLTQHFTEHERDTVLRLIRVAVEQGKTEALIYSFPSDLCADAGRAIHNAQPDWPDTLQGKARELYDRYVEVAKPRGYKLKAMIISFPGGMPGDVGFYLSW
jgi:hypothetical protein